MNRGVLHLQHTCPRSHFQDHVTTISLVSGHKVNLQTLHKFVQLFVNARKLLNCKVSHLLLVLCTTVSRHTSTVSEERQDSQPQPATSMYTPAW